jgi:zinc and cadmium transporter
VSEVLIIYCVLIVLASAAGGALPSLVTFTHRRIQMTLSLVSGVMLGVALLHLLPHAIQLSPQNIDGPMLACLGGLLFMFLLIRMFHFHHHEMAADDGHGEHCSHDHDHSHTHIHESPKNELPIVSTGADTAISPTAGKNFSWIGLTVGLALHTLIDGLALAAAFSAERLHSVLPALGTFLAIVLHKPLDALTITSLMKARHASFQQQTIVNLVFALVCPIGAILFSLSLDQLQLSGQPIVAYSLAFSAGVFLCISLGDLLPEVHFHSHDRVWLSFMLLLGVLIAFAIEKLLGHSHALPTVIAS